MKKAWYWFGDVHNFDSIEFCEQPNGTSDNNSHGPFKTFGEAKRDAIAYFRCDIDYARIAIQEINACRKVKE